MRALAVLSCAALLQGCCCFPSGHHGPSTSSNGGMEQWIAEKATEKAVEVATGNKMDIDASKKKVTVTTPDGTITSWADGSIPDGFPYPLQPNAKVNASMRTDPTDKTQRSTFSVVYEVPASPADTVAWWTKAGKDAGYQVQLMASATSDAFQQAEKQEGVEMPPGVTFGNNMANTGDLLVWQDADQNAIATIVIGSEDAKTQVMVNVPVPGTPAPAEAPAP